MHKRNKKKNMKIIYEKIQFRMRKYIKEKKHKIENIRKNINKLYKHFIYFHIIFF